jgi:uncharacterized protein YmfQ (DUF2313 family)
MVAFLPGWPCAPAQSGAPSVDDKLSDPSADDLLPQILSLTPRGPAWGTDEAGDGQGASPLMRLVWKAIAAWNAASYQVDFTLAEQALPSDITWSLADWEAEYGLPDPCVGSPGDTAARIAAVRAKYAGLGGQSPDYYICLALSLGQNVCSIEDLQYQACRVGARVGDRLYGIAWEYVWTVHADTVPITYARVGDRVGVRLANWGNSILECAINRAKPAHTIVRFAYDGCEDFLLSDDLQPLQSDDGQQLTPQ